MSNASLLQDHEIEVRAATIKDISSFVDLVGPPTFASEVMPHVLALLQDVNLVGVTQRFITRAFHESQNTQGIWFSLFTTAITMDCAQWDMILELSLFVGFFCSKVILIFGTDLPHLWRESEKLARTKGGCSEFRVCNCS